MRIGYACINNTLALEKVKVNRSIVKKTFDQKGVPYASFLALQNISDLVRVVEWNIANQIFFYRLSSDMFPWMSEYEFEELPERNEIELSLSKVGELIRASNMRVTFHPGPFNVLASPNDSVVEKTLKELRQHGEIMDMLGMPRTQFAKVNIHVGGAYGDKAAALDRFALNFERLPETARSRLTIENDDKPGMFSVRELKILHERTGIPIVFDYLHHKFCSGDLSEEEALKMAMKTWPGALTPVVHYSSAKKRYEDSAAMDAAHADYVYEQIETYGLDLDIMLEAKAKELAVLRYRKMLTNSNTLVKA